MLPCMLLYSTHPRRGEAALKKVLSEPGLALRPALETIKYSLTLMRTGIAAPGSLRLVTQSVLSMLRYHHSEILPRHQSRAHWHCTFWLGQCSKYAEISHAYHTKRNASSWDTAHHCVLHSIGFVPRNALDEACPCHWAVSQAVTLYSSVVNGQICSSSCCCAFVCCPLVVL